jgi:protocatechuate 3,4-dioxygenase beta subunit
MAERRSQEVPMRSILRPSRRGFLAGGAAAVVAGAAHDEAFAQQGLALTPQCHDDEPTPRQTEGPYFKPRSPQRENLVDPGMPGELLQVSGFVLTRGCRPVPRALIDVWQADASGAYDGRGFRLRGHLFTGADGRYSLRTIVPGLYPGRTRHIHVKVQAPDGPLLTTQLYLPDEPGNAHDGLFRHELVMRMGEEGRAGRFDFVLDLG